MKFEIKTTYWEGDKEGVVSGLIYIYILNCFVIITNVFSFLVYKNWYFIAINIVNFLLLLVIIISHSRYTKGKKDEDKQKRNETDKKEED